MREQLHVAAGVDADCGDPSILEQRLQVAAGDVFDGPALHEAGGPWNR